jgi:hypothetical protein
MKSGMNIRQCYTVLELPLRAPLEEVKLSYKDLVQVWHPDRFTHSPRLQQKAQDKLQQLNEAYGTLKTHLERQAVEGFYGMAYGTAADYASAGYGPAGQGARADSAATQAQASPAGRRGAAPGDRVGSVGGERRWSWAEPAPSAAGTPFMPSNPSSLRWRLQAMVVILGFMALLLVPVVLALIIAQHPLLVMTLLLLPVGAYGYRVWMTR